MLNLAVAAGMGWFGRESVSYPSSLELISAEHLREGIRKNTLSKRASASRDGLQDAPAIHVSQPGNNPYRVRPLTDVPCLRVTFE
jgi:hypothetical protein